MDRGWYLRFSLLLAAFVASVLALWPSFSAYVPAPGWVTSAFPGRISPGLDIKGGLRLMYDVDVETAITDRRDRLSESLLERLGIELGVFDDEDAPTREELEKTRVRARVQRVGERRIRVQFDKAADAAKLSRDVLSKYFPELREDSREGNVVLLSIREDRLETLREDAVRQVEHVISNRIDELQIREATVQGRGTDLIVEVPGADEAIFERIRTIIGTTARLELKIVDDEGSTAFLSTLTLPEGIERRTEEASAGEGRTVAASYLYAEGPGSRDKLQAFVDGSGLPDDHQLAIGRVERGGDGKAAVEAWRTYYLFNAADVTGEDLKDAYVDFERETGRPVVAFQLTSTGATAFERITGRNVKRRFAIVLDDRVESAPVIQQRIGGGRAQITLGSYADRNVLQEQARDLALVLRAGSLPAPIRPANEQLIGATLGQDSVTQGALGAAVGVLLVLLFMAAYYEVAGIVADVMVLLNVLFLLAILATVEATLTLPGIVGIALTVGMAVDANVLITERIRDELRLGKSPRAAVDQGFKRAFTSIFDGQLTTFIAGVILFQYGTGPIKGFAVTLMIGIMTSLFTGVFCSRVAMEWIVRGLRVQRLRVG